METGSERAWRRTCSDPAQSLLHRPSIEPKPPRNHFTHNALLCPCPCILPLGAPQMKAELKVQDPNIRTRPDVVLASEGKMFEDFRVHIWILVSKKRRRVSEGNRSTSSREEDPPEQKLRVCRTTSSAGIRTSDQVNFWQKLLLWIRFLKNNLFFKVSETKTKLIMLQRLH